MATALHWTCPRCGQMYRFEDPACPVCRITRENRDVVGKTSVERSLVKPAEAVEVHLPYVIQDARFNLPTPDGKTVWAGGWVAAGEAGLFLVGANDGLDPRAVAAAAPAALGALGPTSLFLPPRDVRRLVHEKLVGYWLETSVGKIPLRLPKDAWAELDALCDHLGIRHT